MEPISATPNRFGGLVIDVDALPSEPETFAARLRVSIERWRVEGIRVVWLELPVSLSVLVPPAAEAGFDYHSAAEGSVRMLLRLVEGAEVPPGPTHFVGAGGVVIRDGSDMLVVSERYRRSSGRHLKLPGGALHPGEHIVAAVQREVKEETGIDTEFRSLICFRHWHGFRFGKSDIYFVCRLNPLSFEITRQEDEIDECFWMPVDEYLSDPASHAFNRRIVRAALESPGIAPIELPGYGTPETHEIFMPGDADRTD